MLSAILGTLNLAGAVYLESLLLKEIIINGNHVLPLAHNVCLLLLGYGTAFVGIPLGRYFWLKRHNKKIMGAIPSANSKVCYSPMLRGAR